VILLGGGAKKRQNADISEAIARWQDYKKRKEFAIVSYLLDQEGIQFDLL
jgi:hypothetical protein